MRESMNGEPTFKLKSLISEKSFIFLIIIILMILIRENNSIKNENVVVEMLSIEATVNVAEDAQNSNSNKDVPLEEKQNRNNFESLKIEDIFNQRNQILQRSCSFLRQLNNVNRRATINELKEIHLLLHDLSVSCDEIAKKLKPYDKLETRLEENQENFLNFFFAKSQPVKFRMSYRPYHIGYII